MGTGGPEITQSREGIATLITAGENQLLFDSGRNVMQNIYDAGIDPRDVTQIFLTHLHNDHIEGLPTLWMTGWFLLGRSESIQLWGPVGTEKMTQSMHAMYVFDIENRANAFNDPKHLDFVVSEIQKAGTIYQKDGLTVSAFPVEHDDGDPAFGFKIDYAGRTVVISGDTRLCPTLIEASMGADVVITNILAMSDALAAKPEMEAVVAKLMTVPEAVELFQKTEPRLGAYTHFVTKALPADVDTYIEQATRRAGYTGPLLLGKDGWKLNVETLEVTPPPSVEQLPHLDRKRRYEN